MTDVELDGAFLTRAKLRRAFIGLRQLMVLHFGKQTSMDPSSELTDRLEAIFLTQISLKQHLLESRSKMLKLAIQLPSRFFKHTVFDIRKAWGSRFTNATLTVVSSNEFDDTEDHQNIYFLEECDFSGAQITNSNMRKTMILTLLERMPFRHRHRPLIFPPHHGRKRNKRRW